MFLASAVLMTGLTLIFSYVWYRDYVFIDMLLSPFHRGRNYTVIALYVVMLFTFFTVYGGFQAGSQRIFEAMTSQCLAVVCTNVVTYLQLCILGNWLFLTHFGPMVVVTVVDFVVLLIWSLGTRWAYTKLFPPRRLLVVYGKYSPEDLIMKIASREDKYAIQEAVHYEVGFEGIVEKIDEYGNVILMDIPAIIRNKLLKTSHALCIHIKEHIRIEQLHQRLIGNGLHILGFICSVSNLSNHSCVLLFPPADSDIVLLCHTGDCKYCDGILIGR